MLNQLKLNKPQLIAVGIVILVVGITAYVFGKNAPITYKQLLPTGMTVDVTVSHDQLSTLMASR